MSLRERGYALLDERLWKRIYWLAPVASFDARDFKQAAWEIGLTARHREQLDTVADMVAVCELGSHDPEAADLVELLINILLRFLVLTAYRTRLKALRTASTVVPVGGCDELDRVLLEVAYDELRQSARPDREVRRVLARIMDEICGVPDLQMADALSDAFKYVYGEVPLPAGYPPLPTLHDIATRRCIPPGTLRSRISRLLDDIRLPPDLRSVRHPRSRP